MEKDVAKRPYMQRSRDRTGWDFRVAIPLRLRPHAKQREFKRTLGPTYETACERYHDAMAEWVAMRQSLETKFAGNDDLTTLAHARDRHRVPSATYKYLGDRERRLLDHFVNTWVYRSLGAHARDVPGMTVDERTRLVPELKDAVKNLETIIGDMKPDDDSRTISPRAPSLCTRRNLLADHRRPNGSILIHLFRPKIARQSTYDYAVRNSFKLLRRP